MSLGFACTCETPSPVGGSAPPTAYTHRCKNCSGLYYPNGEDDSPMSVSADRPAKFRKKPVVIEAAQWWKMGDHPNVRPYDTSPFLCHCGRALAAHGWVDTLEGGHIVCPGDWIVTGVKDENYPVKPDIFAETYEPAADRPRLHFENDEMPCGPCGKSTPHRLFGNLWRCSGCGGVSSTCALFPAADRPVENTPTHIAPEEVDWIAQRQDDADFASLNEAPIPKPRELGRMLDRLAQQFWMAEKYENLRPDYRAARSEIEELFASLQQEVVALTDRNEAIEATLGAEISRLRAIGEVR